MDSEFRSKDAATYSFIVGSKYGPRSSEWIVTADSENTYVSAAKFRKLWKVTQHASGQRHVKWVSGSKEPYIDILRKRDRTGQEDEVALFIAIPDDCLRRASNPESLREPSIWLPRPSYGGVTEIAIAERSVSSSNPHWPGQEQGTEMLTIIRTSETRVVIVVGGQLSAEHPAAKSNMRQYSGFEPFPQPVVLDSPERRGVIFGRTQAGALLITEVAID